MTHTLACCYFGEDLSLSLVLSLFGEGNFEWQSRKDGRERRPNLQQWKRETSLEINWAWKPLFCLCLSNEISSSLSYRWNGPVWLTQRSYNRPLPLLCTHTRWQSHFGNGRAQERDWGSFHLVSYPQPWYERKRSSQPDSVRPTFNKSHFPTDSFDREWAGPFLCRWVGLLHWYVWVLSIARLSKGVFFVLWTNEAIESEQK